ncbi:hypothetical protein G7Y89_g12540 [Cudoniella acicularis]|uniref:Uncharacterized protein n=1 Tax=Cudoniella acicularis TaxID=354080 RepID=A0A8H4RCE6_9HELO|nr:hypothetical protein G7Y89_g12540 [Cudoniella acicularis]
MKSLQDCIPFYGILGTALQEKHMNQEELDMVCLTFGTSSTVATLQLGILFPAQRPDLQRTAFMAIKEHYGDRFSVLGDVENDQTCTYIVALQKEFLRRFGQIPRAGSGGHRQNESVAARQFSSRSKMA